MVRLADGGLPGCHVGADASGRIAPVGGGAADDARTRITGDTSTSANVASARTVLPGPSSVALPATIADAIADHARAEYPNEACGVILGSAAAADGGVPLRFVPTRNAAASPYRYEIDSADLLRLTLEADDREEVFWGIVHSHVRSSARPSPTDIGLAFYPDALYILVSLAEDDVGGVTGRPGIRAWRILDGRVFEVRLELADSQS